MGSDGLSLFLFTFVIVGAALVSSIVYSVANSWRRVQELREETDLKRDLLARGMSVDDMVRVLQASRDNETPGAASQPWQARGAWRNPWAQAFGWGCAHRRKKC